MCSLMPSHTIPLVHNDWFCKMPLVSRICLVDRKDIVLRPLETQVVNTVCSRLVEVYIFIPLGPFRLKNVSLERCFSLSKKVASFWRGIRQERHCRGYRGVAVYHPPSPQSWACVSASSAARRLQPLKSNLGSMARFLSGCNRETATRYGTPGNLGNQITANPRQRIFSSVLFYRHEHETALMMHFIQIERVIDNAWLTPLPQVKQV
jgi:hypothetical protein